jgi:hypothetical protein
MDVSIECGSTVQPEVRPSSCPQAGTETEAPCQFRSRVLMESTIAPTGRRCFALCGTKIQPNQSLCLARMSVKSAMGATYAIRYSSCARTLAWTEQK